MPRGVYQRTEKHRQIASAGLRRAWAEGRYADRTASMKDRRGTEHNVWKGEDVGYSGAHWRLTQERGRAGTYSCAECFDDAAEWALNKEASDVRWGDEGHGVLAPYSVNPADYDPLCKSCHRKRDAR